MWMKLLYSDTIPSCINVHIVITATTTTTTTTVFQSCKPI
jgi:hypothetical protein